jgi:photosystem II stability/assembly factor-like uncharacterized protein
MKHNRRTPNLLTVVLLLFMALTKDGHVTGQQSAWHHSYTEPQVDDLQGFHLVSPEEGWLLIDQHFYWTKNAGQSWDSITPSNLDQSIIHAVSFVDTQHGWLVLTNSDESGFTTYAIARTLDGGSTWQTASLSLFRPGDVNSLAGAVYLHFLDSQTGWLVVRRATSSNFSLGTLFKTTDGGNTWTQLTIPIGEPVYFVTSEVGWTAGGAAGDELYRTQDGGRTWRPQAIGSPLANTNQRRLYQLPIFENEWRGVLPVVIADGEEARIEFQHWIMVLPNDEQLLNISNHGKTTTITSKNPLLAGISELDMITPSIGWAKYVSGSCTSALQTHKHCQLEIKLLRTSDGGKTWEVMSLPQRTGGRLEAPAVLEGSNEISASTRSLGNRTETFEGQGFDKCEIPTINQLQNWISNGPYEAVNLYIGGSCRGCANSALSASYVSQMSQQGWKFIPTWVGPQSACWGGTCSSISNDPAIAYNQGVSEANAAIDTAVDLGLALADGSGTAIYYDLEGYDTTNTTCRNAAKAFISGWTARLRERSNQVGVYGSSCASAINDFASISNVPDATWPAHWIYSSYNSLDFGQSKNDRL